MSAWEMQPFQSMFFFFPLFITSPFSLVPSMPAFCTGQANVKVKHFHGYADGESRFKAIAGLVKETKQSTQEALQTLCKM